MEVLSGANNWMLIAQREKENVTLLQCMTCDEKAILPETLWGLPVTVLASRALSPNEAAVSGEVVRITCGADNGKKWDNSALQELTFPPSLRRVGDYALFNCRNLKTLHIYDNDMFWGNGVLMNCRAFNTLEIFQSHGDNGTMAYFAGELSKELDIMVTHPERGVFLRLIFPEYWESYEENSPAHHFDYTLEGAGYPYHHCFKQRKLHLEAYDLLWENSAVIEEKTALRLAWWRLRYPERLEKRAASLYLSYIRQHVKAVATWLIEQNDISGLSTLFRWTDPERATLTFLASLARERHMTAAVALILAEQRRRFHSQNKTFDF